MRHKYKIQVDQPVPADEQISRHKSFDGLLSDYHNLTQPIYRKPLFKNPKAFVGLVLILLMAWLVFEAVSEEDEIIALQKLSPAIKNAAENAFLQPAHPKFKLEATLYERSASAGNNITLPSGTTLQIPANAFVRKDGKALHTSQFTLRIREIKDPLEMIAAGIPMHTAQNSKPQQFVSQLIFEIHAEADGMPLQLREGISISIFQPETQKMPTAPVQLYHLSTSQRAWKVLPPNFEIQKQLLPTQTAPHLPNSGFNIVEFDEEGKPIHPKTSQDSSYTYQQVIHLHELGLISLGYTLPTPQAQTAQLRFTDPNGKPLKLYALYQLSQGLNTVGYFWPRDKDFTFTLKYLPGISQQIFAFTQNGHLAQLTAAQISSLKAQETIQTLPMHISKNPINNISELKQLLDPEPGH